MMLSKYWFSVTRGKIELTGRKLKSGELQLQLGRDTIVLSKDNVANIVVWLTRVYPRRLGNVTYLGLEAELSVPVSEGDSGPGSISPRGELE